MDCRYYVLLYIYDRTFFRRWLFPALLVYIYTQHAYPGLLADKKQPNTSTSSQHDGKRERQHKRNLGGKKACKICRFHQKKTREEGHRTSNVLLHETQGKDSASLMRFLPLKHQFPDILKENRRSYSVHLVYTYNTVTVSPCWCAFVARSELRTRLLRAYLHRVCVACSASSRVHAVHESCHTHRKVNSPLARCLAKQIAGMS